MCLKPTKARVPEETKSAEREEEVRSQKVQKGESRAKTAPDQPLLSRVPCQTLPQLSYVTGPERSWILQERQEVVNRVGGKFKHERSRKSHRSQ